MSVTIKTRYLTYEISDSELSLAVLENTEGVDITVEGSDMR